MTNRIAIDIGGTFTDFALLDSRTGHTAIHKRLTTPSDPARAVLEGVGARRIAEGQHPLAIEHEHVGEDLLITARLREW